MTGKTSAPNRIAQGRVIIEEARWRGVIKSANVTLE